MTSLAINLWICGGVAAACWLASVLTREYSWVDRLWSIIPVVYVWVFAAKAGDPSDDPGRGAGDRLGCQADIQLRSAWRLRARRRGLSVGHHPFAHSRLGLRALQPAVHRRLPERTAPCHRSPGVDDGGKPGAPRRLRRRGRTPVPGASSRARRWPTSNAGTSTAHTLMAGCCAPACSATRATPTTSSRSRSGGSCSPSPSSPRALPCCGPASAQCS